MMILQNNSIDKSQHLFYAGFFYINKLYYSNIGKSIVEGKTMLFIVIKEGESTYK
jgi:hypothetical protein